MCRGLSISLVLFFPHYGVQLAMIRWVPGTTTNYTRTQPLQYFLSARRSIVVGKSSGSHISQATATGSLTWSRNCIFQIYNGHNKYSQVKVMISLYTTYYKVPNWHPICVSTPIFETSVADFGSESGPLCSYIPPQPTYFPFILAPALYNGCTCRHHHLEFDW